MSDTDLEALTPEEAEAMEAMKADIGEDTAPEPTPEDIEAPQEAASEPVEAETPAEPEGEPEKAAEDDSKPPAGFVPHGAMHAERMRAQAAETALNEMRAEIEALKAAQPAPEPEPVPDQFADPEAYNAWVQKQAQAPLEQVQKIQEQLREQQELQQLNGVVIADEQAFVKEKPDYKEAIDFALQARAKQLAIFAPDGTPEAQLLQAAQQERVDVVRQAIAAGRRPAEVLYRISEGFGYQAKQTAPASGPTEAEKVTALANAQAATQSLTTAPGASAAAEITLDYLAGLDDEAYAKIQAQRPEDVARALGA